MLTPMAGQETRDLAGAVDSTDPTVGLAAVASLRALVERLEALHVTNARERGWSWQEVVLAQEEAGRLRHGWIGTEHLLLGVLRADGGGARLLKGFGLDYEAV